LRRILRSLCFPTGGPNSKTTEPGVKRIKFYDILWAEVKDDVLTIDYAVTNSSKATLAKVELGTEAENKSAAEDLAKRILEKAYGGKALLYFLYNFTPQTKWKEIDLTNKPRLPPP